jgi:D-proline reductase (dithiol) PrdB
MATYVSYVDVTKAAFPDQPPYQWTVNESAPWTPIVKPLAESKLVLIASGGVYIKDQSPFNSIKNDLTFREIPRDTDVKSLRISHDFYDHTDAEQDINCIFPIERLRELEQEGFIGKLSEVHFTFMGRIFKKTSLLNEMIPHLIGRLKELSIDLAFLVPA